VVPYSNRYELLSQRLGIDFSTIILALTNIPLCLRGSAHQEKRRTIAKIIAEQTEEVQSIIPAVVANRFACLNLTGQHDVLNTAIIPSADDVLSVIVGMPLGLAENSLISRVFSRNIGVSKRKKMEAELHMLRNRLTERFSKMGTEQIGVRLALAVVGRDALIGTLANSLHEIFASQKGTRLCDIAYDQIPLKTGVPYIDRVATEDGEAAGTYFLEGAEVTVRLDAYEASEDPKDRLGFFGHGRHLCLGRPLSLDLWRAIVSHLSSVDRRVVATRLSLRKDDVFCLPSEFLVEVE
jgi:hypothetical protein